MSISKGTLFNSKVELEKVISDYESKNYVKLWKRNARTVAWALKKWPSRTFSETIGYYEVLYSCIHGGRKHKATSTGERPNQKTFRQDCPFYLKIRATKDGTSLECSDINAEHNHPCTEAGFKHLPAERRLATEDRDHVLDMLKVEEEEGDPNDMDNEDMDNEDMDTRSCKISWNSYFSEMSWMLHKLRDEKQYTDATISCCGCYYPVHKVVLAASSQYFEELFNQTDKLHPLVHAVIVLNDVEKSELEALLNFIYLGEVSVKKKDIQKLLKVAHMLKIKGLHDKDLQNICSAKKGIKSICLTRQGKHGTADRSKAHLVNSDNIIGEDEEKGEKRKLKGDDECAFNIKIESVSSGVSCFVKKDGSLRRRAKRLKMVAEDNDEISEGSVSEDELSVLEGCEENTYTAQTPTRSVGEEHAELRSSATHHHDIQSKDEDGAVETDDETADPSSNKDIFIAVGIGDLAEPVPGPSGYCSANDAANQKGKGDVNSEDGEDDEFLLRIKEEIVDDTDGGATHAIYFPMKDDCAGGEMVKEELENSDDQDSLGSDLYPNSPDRDHSGVKILPEIIVSQAEFIPDEDLPNFMKSQQLYKLSPSLSLQLKGQFWDQEGVHRIMIGIKDQEISLKEAAKLLGTTYSLMYRQYSSIYGGIKQLHKVAKESCENPGNVDPKNFRKVELHACPHCPYKNPYEHNFLQHLKCHMGETSSKSGETSQSDEPTSNKIASSEKDLISCSICSAKFAHLRTLKSHMRIHLHVTPLVCPFCCISFDHKTVFKRHLDAHKNEKIFDCPVCQAKFANRYTLNDHLKLHYY